MADCTVELPQVIILLVILIVIFLFIYKNKEHMTNNDDKEIKKTSEMYIPNCNFLTDKDICEQTKACYYYKGGCRYDWSKLQ
jgi:hypothetical protein